MAGESPAALAASLSRFLGLAGIFSRFARSVTAQAGEGAAEKDGDLGEPPELVPKFLPTVRRAISRFLSPRKRRIQRNRRAQGWRALLARFAYRTKFMSPPAPPPKPKPPPPEPPKKRPGGGSSLRGRFNRPLGPK